MEEPTLDALLEAHSLQVYNHSYDYDAPIDEHGKSSKQVGLKGEAMDLVSPNRGSSVDWIRGSLATRTKQTLKWYKELGGDPSKITLVKRSVTGGSLSQALLSLQVLELLPTATCGSFQQGTCHATNSHVIVE
ncbi:beta-galactosidase [Prunus yedoensis var. nudiflora]|uniref:Beta-galactosidase n=1 Tax=Prunus yedoensis var. nudiflora TaxID=2094558 RepID=A0A314YBV2_PRUYE|nr:beta-galactosidase [Prunus yedoensis var. nudiflora]